MKVRRRPRPEQKRELLFSITKKDLSLTWFSGSGAGGQHRNKHQNCCRIIHGESGAIGTGQGSRSRVANQREALRSLVKNAKFRAWHARKCANLMRGESVESIVKRMMAQWNLLVEVRKDDEWVAEQETES